MNWNKNRPAKDDSLEVSQPIIKENFISIEEFIGADHDNFNTGNDGKHKKITLLQNNKSESNINSQDIIMLFAITSLATIYYDCGIKRLGESYLSVTTQQSADGENPLTTNQTRLSSGILISSLKYPFIKKVQDEDGFRTINFNFNVQYNIIYSVIAIPQGQNSININAQITEFNTDEVGIFVSLMDAIGEYPQVALVNLCIIGV